MTMSMLSILPITVISAIATMLIQRRHTLMALLALEAMILMLLALVMTTTQLELFMSFIILTVGACEASLGLACLVLMIRSHGNDMISSITSNKC